MGRKKKKATKPWCWYCNRDFDEEKILIQHQKAKHFKCPICHKKLYTGPGLAIHCMQVHKETISTIPNSIPNRGDPEVEIYGMEGIPEKDMKERQQKGGSVGDDNEPEKKKVKTDEQPQPATAVMMPGLPGAVPVMPVMPLPGMPLPPGFPQVPFGHPIPGASHMPPMSLPGRMPVPMGIPAPGMPEIRPGFPPNSTPSSSTATVTTQHQKGPVIGPQVPKPLFPAAQNVNGGAMPSSSSGPVGADFKPLQSVAPATSYQSAPVPSTGKSAGPPPTSASVVSKPAMIVAPGATSRLIHPDEDISLEERRASIPKYAPKTPSLPSSNPPTMASAPPVQIQAPGNHPPLGPAPLMANLQQPPVAMSSAPAGPPPGGPFPPSPMPGGPLPPGMRPPGFPHQMPGPPPHQHGMPPGMPPRPGMMNNYQGQPLMGPSLQGPGGPPPPHGPPPRGPPGLLGSHPGGRPPMRLPMGPPRRF
ncbi:BUB3-interacting and GLEBS motif-containing protein ZNF207-like [Acropora millepora]|uniref:BUB3-interacting and GLEBS motif-containing protein ZNF207-like n=1 Tax=Acropora millepora TaxID=45264 RepID=UPI0010FC8A6D|nr:BUB3-interacting and GLEBS motif-containing protein ZNF207-like [Acropora millepora]XP_044185257.1 BUB3-interacting and GLEBS motif-containing protein ZNF207-like [Acropora millepora]